jgi:hypothetical protein
MARQLILAIAESAESLEQQLKNSRTASQKERLQMLWWLNQTYQLNLTYPTVYHWVHYRLKAKLKVPRPKSAKQEPNADRRFKKTSPQLC